VYEAGYRPAIFLLAIWLCPLARPEAAQAMELGADTLQAWNQYIQAMQARSKESMEPGQAFLRLDAHPAKRQMLREGRVLVWPATRGGAMSVPSGLIHNWVGTVFIPDATLDQVLAVVRDFDNYKDHYQPSVIGSKLLGQEGNDYEFRLRFQKTVLMETATVDCTFREQFVAEGPHRVFSHSLSTSAQEVKHLGGAHEHDLPDGAGKGYLWRLGAESRFEAADGGVYVELEAVGLSRDIPAVLRLLLDPIVRTLSHNALEESLRQTRQAVLESLGKKAVDPKSRPMY
jgi:hypothetical protein